MSPTSTHRRNVSTKMDFVDMSGPDGCAISPVTSPKDALRLDDHSCMPMKVVDHERRFVIDDRD